MQNLRKHLRVNLTWAFILGLVPVAVSVIAEFFIELAREKGLYEKPSETVSNVMAALATITGSWWFITPGLLITGAAGAFWLEYLIRKWPFKSSQGRVGGAVQAGNVDNQQDRVLIPSGIWLSCEHHQDGLDIVPVIAIRNGGLLPLQVRIKTWDCEIAGVKPENKAGVSCSAEMRPSTSQNIGLTKVRLFDPADSMKGWVTATFILRLGANQVKYAMMARYAFAISGIPTNKGKIRITDLTTDIKTLLYKAVSDD